MSFQIAQGPLDIIDGSGEAYRIVGVDVRALLRPVDHPERGSVWVSQGELDSLLPRQAELRCYRAGRLKEKQ